MKPMRKGICLLVIALLLAGLGSAAFAAPGGSGTGPGDVMQDFEVNLINGTLLLLASLLIAASVLLLIENIKLAKDFGKGAGIGLLLFVFKNVGRFILGLSRAQYQREQV